MTEKKQIARLFPVYHGRIRVGTVKATNRYQAYCELPKLFPDLPIDYLMLYPYDAMSDGYLPPRLHVDRAQEFSV